MWMIRDIAAGAGGIVAMEIASYLDMLVRGRPVSNQPQELGDALADRLEFAPGASKAAKAKRSALGSLVGYVDGLALPAASTMLGLRRGPIARQAALLTGGAMVGSSALPTILGITDPRQWTPDDWLTDLVPHVAYGVVATLISRSG